MAEEKAAKGRKKMWYSIIAPKLFGEQVLGQTIAFDANVVVGRTVLQNLMNLTNEVKKQNTNIKFEVINVEGDRAKTKLIGYEIVPSSIKRMVRRNNIKIDMSFTIKTADNMNVRIKPLLLTKSDTVKSIATKIRRITQDMITKSAAKVQFDELMSDLVTHKLQNSLRDLIKKVYPLRTCEIRYAGIERTEAKKEEKAEV